MSNEIVSDNGHVIGSMDHLYYIASMARKRDFNNREIFNSNNYKWVLGIKVASDALKAANTYLYKDSSEAMTLFGIRVEIDYVNPENVKLWKDVTDL